MYANALFLKRIRKYLKLETCLYYIYIAFKQNIINKEENFCFSICGEDKNCHSRIKIEVGHYCSYCLSDV